MLIESKKVSNILPYNNSETASNEHDKEIAKGRYISPEARKKIADDLRLTLIWMGGEGGGNFPTPVAFPLITQKQ